MPATDLLDLQSAGADSDSDTAMHPADAVIPLEKPVRVHIHAPRTDAALPAGKLAFIDALEEQLEDIRRDGAARAKSYVKTIRSFEASPAPIKPGRGSNVAAVPQRLKLAGGLQGLFILREYFASTKQRVCIAVFNYQVRSVLAS